MSTYPGFHHVGTRRISRNRDFDAYPRVGIVAYSSGKPHFTCVKTQALEIAMNSPLCSCHEASIKEMKQYCETKGMHNSPYSMYIHWHSTEIGLNIVSHLFCSICYQLLVNSTLLLVNTVHCVYRLPDYWMKTCYLFIYHYYHFFRQLKIAWGFPDNLYSNEFVTKIVPLWSEKLCICAV